MIGRTLAIDTSFFMQFTNASASNFTINLFNLGSGAGSITPFVYGTLSSSFSQSVINLVSSVFNANGVITIYDGSNAIISTQAVTIGSSLSSYLTNINPLVDSSGNTGVLFIQPTPNGTNTQYDFACTNIVISRIEFAFSTTYNVLLSQITTNFVRTNPFITALSTTPIDQITKSQIGYAYRIITMDVYSNDTRQILEPIIHGSKDANGDDFDTILAPTIDPFQDVSVSIHGLDSINFIINASTTFSYRILAGATSRLTFNYVPITISDLAEFQTALNQRIAMEFLKKKKILTLASRQQIIVLQ